MSIAGEFGLVGLAINDSDFNHGKVPGRMRLGEPR